MGKVGPVVHPFNPVFDCQSEILILGSFPSVISRKQNFYYANKSNRFWKVMEILFAEKIEDPKKFCHQHHIALWDVIYSCSIHGSSDASISDVVVNPIGKIVDHSNVHTIFLTGKKQKCYIENM